MTMRPKTCPGVPSGAPPPLSDYDTFEVEAKTDPENFFRIVQQTFVFKILA